MATTQKINLNEILFEQEWTPGMENYSRHISRRRCLGLFSLFLIVHLLGVCLVVGGGIFQRFFIEMPALRVAGQPAEWGLIRQGVRTGVFFMAGSALLLVGGIGLTVLGRFGWFQLSWLGVKQMIMAAIVVAEAAYLGPLGGRLQKELAEFEDKAPAVPDELRQRFRQLVRGHDLLHVAGLVNIVFAVWRPF